VRRGIGSGIFDHEEVAPGWVWTMLARSNAEHWTSFL